MKNKRKLIKEMVLSHIKSNKIEYIIITTFFILGTIIGIIISNKTDNNMIEELRTYIQGYILDVEKIKNENLKEIFMRSISENVRISVILWFLGTTIIGIIIVLAIVTFRGFCLGYTISICTRTLGINKAIAFIIDGLLLQNILFIPALIGLGFSGLKLCKEMIRGIEKENIKNELIRHTIFCIIMSIFLIISSILESYGSLNMLRIFGKYF